MLRIFFGKIFCHLLLNPKLKKRFLSPDLVYTLSSTNFSNLKNKEKNEGFEESPYSKSGEKKSFFNLGFKNRWQKILPKNIILKLNNTFQNDLNDLGYNLNE